MTDFVIDEIPSMADEAVLLDWLAEMRDRHPVAPDRWGVWHVFRHHDVRAVLRDPKTFSSDLTHAIEGATPTPGMIHEMDPPEHHVLRRVVSSAFTPRRVADLEPRIRDIVRALLDGVDDRFDLVEAIAFPLPATVTAELLGLPNEDHDRFRAWSEALVDIPMDDPTDPELAHRIDELLGPLGAYLRERCRERRQAPGDDLISALVTAEAGGRRLDDEEAANFSMALLLAGHITTTVLLGNIVRTLDEYPEHWAAAADDPGCIPEIVEEVLRYRPSFPQMQRTTTQEAEIDGVVLPPGVMVNVWVLSANRDPLAHKEPDVFDPSRGIRGPAQLAFGHGVHFCLGAPLARLENRVALEELVARFGRLAVDTQPDRPHGGVPPFDQVVFGVRQLPVRAVSLA